jgi:hypothetical protein
MRMRGIFLAGAALLALSACDTTSNSVANKPATAEVGAKLSVQEQVQQVKQQCEQTSLTRAQWYRCWVPQAEAIHARANYPHMDLLKAHTAELLMIVRSMENGAFTPEQSEAMVAQSQIRFTNAVRERENQNRERELESWRQFRQYIQNPY